jgi:hypothetical protein
LFWNGTFFFFDVDVGNDRMSDQRKTMLFSDILKKNLVVDQPSDQSIDGARRSNVSTDVSMGHSSRTELGKTILPRK